MSYRCNVCTDPVPGGRAQLRIVVQRPNGQAARELAVCPRCYGDVARGASLGELIRLYQPRQAATSAAAPPPPAVSAPSRPPAAERVDW